MRLLFVYGFEPSGHASAARALEDAARALGLEAECANVSEHHSWLGPLIARGYLWLVQRFPGVWRRLYDNETIAALAQSWRNVYLAFNHRRLERTLRKLRPDVIVCTHAPPLGALALEKARGRLSCPLAGVVTDFRAHTYWLKPGADLYLAPTQAAAQDMLDRGIPAAHVRVTGIPIHPTFAQPIDCDAARSRLGIPAGVPVLFLSGGSRGLGKLAAMAQALLTHFPDARILTATGSNAAVLRSLKARYRHDHRLWVYPGLDPARVKELMCAADLMIGKAGGVTISESLALGLPMVFFEPIPGQEAQNAEFLCEQRAALCAASLGELPRLAAEALEPERLAELRRHARRLGRPDSAREAVQVLASMFHGAA